jgi:hypothetical protein
VNLDDSTTILQLLDQVRALDEGRGRESIFFQRLIVDGKEHTIAVGTGDAGRLIEGVMTRLLQQRGIQPDPRSGPGVPALPWDDRG